MLYMIDVMTLGMTTKCSGFFLFLLFFPFSIVDNLTRQAHQVSNFFYNTSKFFRDSLATISLKSSLSSKHLGVRHTLNLGVEAAILFTPYLDAGFTVQFISAFGIHLQK